MRGTELAPISLSTLFTEARARVCMHSRGRGRLPASYLCIYIYLIAPVPRVLFFWHGSLLRDRVDRQLGVGEGRVGGGPRWRKIYGKTVRTENGIIDYEIAGVPIKDD